MLSRVAAAVVVLILAACASSGPPVVRVDVEEVTASDRWRVTIRQPEPATAFLFPRSRHAFRAATWSIIEPRTGAQWETVDGQDAIVVDTPTDRIVIDFPSNFSLLAKDYPLNAPFTDGSRLLYTGHLRTRTRGTTVTRPHIWTFQTSPTRPIRIFGDSAAGRLRWEQFSADETFVYFGPIMPELTSRMTLIVDPGLPEWVEKQMRDRVPRQFDYFAAKTQTELPFTPLIVVSYGGSEGSGKTFAGHGLQGMLAITISGEKWMPRTADAEQYWFRHLAHEAFHLWGSQAYRYAEEAEWLSEAAAEYASLLVSRDLGVMSDEAILRFIRDAEKACAPRLGTMPLRDSIAAGQSRNLYTCGVVSQKIVDDAARAAGTDIWSVWRTTYAQQRPYTTADFIEAVRVTTRSEETASFIDELVNRGLAGDVLERLRAGR